MGTQGKDRQMGVSIVNNAEETLGQRCRALRVERNEKVHVAAKGMGLNIKIRLFRRICG